MWVHLCMLIIEKKYILILGKGPTQELDDNTLTAENEYSINFTEQHKKFILSLHYNGVNSHIFVNCFEIYRFKAKGFEIHAVPLCFGYFSKYFSVDNIKRTGLYGYVLYDMDYTDMYTIFSLLW